MDITRFHLTSLELELEFGDPRGEQVPIAVQAHFEGILHAFIAAWDQVREAINIAFSLDLGRHGRAVEEMPESPLRTSLHDWERVRIALDARDIRKRATHHHYVKTPGALRVEVQPPALPVQPYGGPRDLVEYGKAVVDHATRLRLLLDDMAQQFSTNG